MVLYGITPIPPVEELSAAVPKLLVPFYADDAAFNGPEDRSARLRTLIMERGTARGYFPEPSKSLFICDSTDKEKTVKKEFEAEGLRANVVPGSLYLGACVRPAEDRDAWVRLQVEKWEEDVRYLEKYAKQHPQTVYAGLGMLLQLDWK